MMTSWEQFVAQVADTRLEDLEPAAVEAVTAAFIDTIAVMIDARDEETPRRVREALSGMFGAEGSCVLVGQDGPGVAEALALVHNGTLAHVLDYDDTHGDVGGHASALLVPTILTVGESVGASGAQMLLAYAVGLEVAAAVGRHMGKGGYRKGWHYTSIVGPVGCAAAAGVLLGLNREQFLVALSTGASVSHGLKANFGTMTKSFHVGWSAMGGAAAARLALRGFSSQPDAVIGAKGLTRLISDTTADDFVAPTTVGDALTKQGLNMKVFPCCAQSHATLIAAQKTLLDLNDQRPDGWTNSDIDSVSVRIHPDYKNQLIYMWPTEGLEGKFSLRYLLSAMLTDRTITNDTFTLASLSRLTESGMLERITVVEDDTLHSEVVQLDVSLRDGASASFSTVPGERAFNPEHVASLLEKKFVDCSSQFYGEQGARHRFALLQRMASLPGAEIFQALRADR